MMLQRFHALHDRKKNHQCKLVEITPENVILLQRLLDKLNREDLYSTSTAYFLMTGRRGLWIYGNEDTAMIIARHPNLDDSILFFPPMGISPVNLIELALTDPVIPRGNRKLARLGPEDQYLAAVLEQRGNGDIEVEEILDWKFPVHILDTVNVVEARGKDFRDFRKNIHRAFGRGLWSENINSQEDIYRVLEISKSWAERHVSANYSVEDLIGPTKYALSLFNNPNLSINGLIINEGSEAIGYVMWEETNLHKGFANSISGMSIRPRGTEEFAIMEMCKNLSSRGFCRVCIGGSETEGLDSFKRKMCPISSVGLSTMSLN